MKINFHFKLNAAGHEFNKNYDNLTIFWPFIKQKFSKYFYFVQISKWSSKILWMYENYY